MGARRLLAAGALAALLPLTLTGCETDETTSPEDGTQESWAPSEAQLRLDDIPPSMVPTSSGLREERVLACDSANFPGEAFVCLSRHLFAVFGKGFSDMVVTMFRLVSHELATHEVPPGVSLTFEDDPDVHITVLWEHTDEGRTYSITFTDVETDETVGEWAWTKHLDGSASGRLAMLAAAMGGDEEDGPSSIVYEFEASADGSEKAIGLHLVAPADETDSDAPTGLAMDATKIDGLWTLRYATYHPTLLAGEEAMGEEFQGALTTVLVTAVGYAEPASPAAMNVIAVPGQLTTLPADAEETETVCAYVNSFFDEATIECADTNPFVVDADGEVVSGGTPPDGYDGLLPALDGAGWVTTNPAAVGESSLSF